LEQVEQEQLIHHVLEVFQGTHQYFQQLHQQVVEVVELVVEVPD
jgi:hypothetical protein